MLTSQGLNRISFFDRAEILLSASDYLLENDQNTEGSLSEEFSLFDADIKMLGFFFEGFLLQDLIQKQMESLSEWDKYNSILRLNDGKTKITIEASAGKEQNPVIKISVNDSMRVFTDKNSLLQACSVFESRAMESGVLKIAKSRLAYVALKEKIDNKRGV